MLASCDDEQRLEPAQHAVASPVLGKLDGRARKVVRDTRFELLLEFLEEGERVGRGAGEADEQLAALKRRTFCAFAFMTVSPTVTWPSPPSATSPSLRTARMVVARMVGIMLCMK